MAQRNYYHLFILLAVFQTSFSQRRIKDGNEVLSDKKYVVYILRASSARHKYHGWLCGGAIITKDYVITSAACVQDVRHMYVIPGYKKYVPDKDLPKDKCITEMRKKVILTCVPTNYEFKFDKTEMWAKIDIAVIKVESPFDFNDKSYETYCSYIPEPINFNMDSDFPKPGDDVIVLGWGHNKEFRKDKELVDMNLHTLHYASTKVLDEETCVTHFQGNQELVSLITSSMLCTLEPGNLDDKGEHVLRSPIEKCITKKERLEGMYGKMCDEEKGSEVLPNIETTTTNDDSAIDTEIHNDPMTTMFNTLDTVLSTTNPTTASFESSDPDLTTILITTTNTIGSVNNMLRSTNHLSITTIDSIDINPMIITTDNSDNDYITTFTVNSSNDPIITITDSSNTDTITTTTDSSDTDTSTTMFINRDFLVDEDYPTVSPINYDEASNNLNADENSWDVGVDVLRRKFRKNTWADTDEYGKKEEITTPEPDSKSDSEINPHLPLRDHDFDEYHITDDSELVTDTTSPDNTVMTNDPERPIDTTHSGGTKLINESELQNDTASTDETTPINELELPNDTESSSDKIQINDSELPTVATRSSEISEPISATNLELLDDTVLPEETTPPNEPQPSNDKEPKEIAPPNETTLINEQESSIDIAPLDETTPINESELTKNKSSSGEKTPVYEPELPNEITPQDETTPVNEPEPSNVTVPSDETTTINQPEQNIDDTENGPGPKNFTTSTRERSQDEIKYTPGICQNDHGGPLVAWKDGAEILVAIATLYKLDKDQLCMGPYLFTTTASNAAFINCIVEDYPDATRRNCDKPEEVGFKIDRRHISWVGHRDGPADNERISMRDQVPMSAFHPYA